MSFMSSGVTDLSKRLTSLWQISRSERDKPIKLLSKIFNNIISNPSNQKFGDLNYNKIRIKFEKCRPGFYLLYDAGFKQSTNGQRLQWEYNENNINILQKVNNALQSKIKDPNTFKYEAKKNTESADITRNNKYKRQIQQQMKKEQTEKEKQREAIKERITASRKEQKLEQKRIAEKIREKQAKRSENAVDSIKEQFKMGLNNMMTQWIESQASPQNNEAIEFDKTDKENQQKFKEMATKLDEMKVSSDTDDNSEYLLDATRDFKRGRIERNDALQSNMVQPTGINTINQEELAQNLLDAITNITNQSNEENPVNISTDKDKEIGNNDDSQLHSEEEKQENVASVKQTDDVESDKQYDEEVVNELVSLELATRDEIIKASQMAEDYKDANSVFDKLEEMINNNSDQQEIASNVYSGDSDSLTKMSEILKKYQQQNQNDNKSLEDINKYDIACILEDFHNVLDSHDHDFENVYNKLIKECNGGKPCDLSECLFMRRNHRDRAALRINDIELREIYNDSDDVKDIVIQQTLDKIHCHFFHSFDTGYKLTENDRNKIREIAQNDEKNESKEVDVDVYDPMVTAINSFIKDRVESRGDLKGLTRLNRENTKFSTTVGDEKESVPNEDRYSFGVRFFYWDLYKNNMKIVDQARITHAFQSFPANDKYTLGEFYVEPKFKDFKEEMINNPIEGLSARQFNICMKKAEINIQTKEFKDKQVEVEHCEVLYNLVRYSNITVSHLMSVMIYCNRDSLQMKLSQTYRRIPQNESNVSIVERHSNYAHLGRLLRESVECYGWRVDNRYQHQSLYHGISIQTQFASMYACIKGPCSTSKDYAVAAGFCGNKGMILELRTDMLWTLNKSRKKECLFECQYVSDFVNEKEVFFIGGYAKHFFQSIIRAPFGQNYKHYVGALKEISTMMSASMFFNMDKQKELPAIQQQLIYRIVSHQLHKAFPDNQEYHQFISMPQYAQGLVDRHFAGIKQYSVEEPSKPTYIGSEDRWKVDDTQSFLYKLFRFCFFYDYGWVKLDVLSKIFPSLYEIVLWTQQPKHVELIKNKAIYLSVLDFIQNNKEPKLQCIKIFYPHNTEQIATEIVGEFRDKFQKYGWMIHVDGGQIKMETIYAMLANPYSDVAVSSSMTL